MCKVCFVHVEQNCIRDFYVGLLSDILRKTTLCNRVLSWKRKRVNRKFSFIMIYILHIYVVFIYYIFVCFTLSYLPFPVTRCCISYHIKSLHDSHNCTEIFNHIFVQWYIHILLLDWKLSGKVRYENKTTTLWNKYFSTHMISLSSRQSPFWCRKGKYL